MKVIDINSDMGEGFGRYTLGDDEALMQYISSANIACGFHAGDPRIMERVVAGAARRGIGIGAHVGFPDLVGFGRRNVDATPEEIRTDIIYQLGALDAFCRVCGTKLRHVKPHGALYLMAVNNAEVSTAIVEAVKAYDPNLTLVVLPHSETERIAREKGLPVALEIFGDRTYNSDGTLVSRRRPDAVIHDVDEVVRRVVRMVKEGKVRTIDGQDIDMTGDTVCVHSDTPGAVQLAKAIREGLEREGIEIRPMGH